MTTQTSIHTTLALAGQQKAQMQRLEHHTALAIHRAYAPAHAGISQAGRVLVSDIQAAQAAGVHTDALWLRSSTAYHTFTQTVRQHALNFSTEARMLATDASQHAKSAGVADGHALVKRIAPPTQQVSIPPSWQTDSDDDDDDDDDSDDDDDDDDDLDAFDALPDNTQARIWQFVQGALAVGLIATFVGGGLALALAGMLSGALGIARTALWGSYRAGVSITFTVNASIVYAWVWVANLGSACAACTAMHGTIHSAGETLDSHPNCECQQVPLAPGQTWPTDGTGSDWFANQSADMQQSIVGPAAYAAMQAGDLSFGDLLGTASDGSIYQRSLKQLGLNANQYLNS